MADKNIKYEKGLVSGKTGAIERKIDALDSQIEREYGNMLAAFEKSQCSQAEKLREELQTERETVEILVEFYRDLVRMIQNASMDVDRTETSYANMQTVK